VNMCIPIGYSHWSPVGDLSSVQFVRCDVTCDVNEAQSDVDVRVHSVGPTRHQGPTVPCSRRVTFCTSLLSSCIAASQVADMPRQLDDKKSTRRRSPTSQLADFSTAEVRLIHFTPCPESNSFLTAMKTKRPSAIFGSVSSLND